MWARGFIEAMRILVKYPTRQRPEIFLHRLREYVDGAADMLRITFLVSLDLDDVTMDEGVFRRAMDLHQNVILVGGNSRTKIEACNADVQSDGDVFGRWDILLLISDDMQLRLHHWDARIRRDMTERYLNRDGCLWYHDGTKQRVINTMSCMGREYYERFGYIYHPSYASFFCDNEYTEVATGLGKMTRFDTVIASHEHPAWNGGMKRDALYNRNNVYWKQDKENYERRKAAGFPQALDPAGHS